MGVDQLPWRHASWSTGMTRHGSWSTPMTSSICHCDWSTPMTRHICIYIYITALEKGQKTKDIFYMVSQGKRSILFFNFFREVLLEEHYFAIILFHQGCKSFHSDKNTKYKSAWNLRLGLATALNFTFKMDKRSRKN